ncbi:MAG TPA: GNAT family N-acetyltransferase [Pirellulales bacterium]|nr:GNAT family N-acetyltransferase [Pirellulales bacterium]
MPLARAVVECPIHESFRVAQVAGMFDVPLAEKCREAFEVDVPSLDEDWQIGVIVGPSGSGKSTIARQVFGDAPRSGGPWPPDRAVIDGFDPDVSIKRVTRLLTAVGFSSPPAWIKPYRVLSCGEQFRCDLARALLASRELVVFDEFTSVVDRTVAKIGSAAVSQAVRSGDFTQRFVAVTCHYDVVEWLEPDWVVDMATRTLTRRRLRRPDLRLEVFRCRRDVWPLFARHHYLSGKLSPSAQCYLGLVDGRPAAFCAVLPSIGHAGVRRVSRLVVLPDYQGIGIGSRLRGAVADLLKAAGYRVTITASHPALIGHLQRSPHWRIACIKRQGSSVHAGAKQGSVTSTGRAVVSAEYVRGV